MVDVPDQMDTARFERSVAELMPSFRERFAAAHGEEARICSESFQMKQMDPVSQCECIVGHEAVRSRHTEAIGSNT